MAKAKRADEEQFIFSRMVEGDKAAFRFFFDKYYTFLEHNAETLWTKGTNKQEVLFGTYWGTKPGSTTDLTTQTSGAMLMEAASLLENEGLINP